MSMLENIIKFVNTRYNKGFDVLIKKVKITCADKGICVAEFKVEEEHCNILGKLHGGFTSTLVDNISSLALTTLVGDKPHLSVDLNVSFTKPAVAGDEVVVEATALKTGKTLAFLEVTLYDKKTNALIAKGSQTKFVLLDKK